LVAAYRHRPALVGIKEASLAPRVGPRTDPLARLARRRHEASRSGRSTRARCGRTRQRSCSRCRRQTSGARWSVASSRRTTAEAIGESPRHPSARALPRARSRTLRSTQFSKAG
jgi:hypothetical protein